MDINGSTLYYTKSFAGIDRQQSSAKLTLKESTTDSSIKLKYSEKDTLVLSDGAKVHIADNIVGPNGVGNGNAYNRITNFLEQSLEQTLGSEVSEISIDDLEVDSSKISLKTKQATPTQYPTYDGIAYHMKSSKANVNLNEITVEGTVKTSDGQELQFSLDIDTCLTEASRLSWNR